MKLLESLLSLSTAQVQNGQTCIFWQDNWLEEPLKDKYPELFLFAKSKAISVGKFYAHDPITREFSLPLSASVLKNNDSGLRSSGPKRRAAMLWTTYGKLCLRIGSGFAGEGRRTGGDLGAGVDVTHAHALLPAGSTNPSPGCFSCSFFLPKRKQPTNPYHHFAKLVKIKTTTTHFFYPFSNFLHFLYSLFQHFKNLEVNGPGSTVLCTIKFD